VNNQHHRIYLSLLCPLFDSFGHFTECYKAAYLAIGYCVHCFRRNHFLSSIFAYSREFIARLGFVLLSITIVYFILE
jgi:hypothetical protein